MQNTFVSPEKVALQDGLTKTQLIGKYYTSNEVPACCSHGCLIKPDDTCEHGNPSVLAELHLV